MISGRTDITDRQLEALGELVYRHCGIDLHQGKKELVQARLAKRIRALGCSGVAEYLQKHLGGADAPEFAHLIDALSTNLTCFFRENSHFTFLRERLVPELIRQKNAKGDRRIRAWSAGCSSGEEPYSIAMTLLQAIPDSASWDIKLLATDISRPVLEAARDGCYSAQRIADIPPALRQRYLHAQRGGEPGGVEVAPCVRDVVRFNYLNLMKDWPFDGPFDFIFCRNVMIYFDKPTQEKLVNRFHGVLGASGVLFTGHSESLTGVTHPFKYVAPTIYARTAGRAA